MRLVTHGVGWTLAAALAVMSIASSVDMAARQAQSEQKDSAAGSKTAPAPAAIKRLKIEVTGGDDNKPVENASVYLKTLDQKLLKDKKFEVNVKTNLQGVAHVPEAPTGRVLIQIVATGWKPYGHWYDVSDQEQTIKVHLERPPKWY